jgi:hypothetical protein
LISVERTDNDFHAHGPRVIDRPQPPMSLPQSFATESAFFNLITSYHDSIPLMSILDGEWNTSSEHVRFAAWQHVARLSYSYIDGVSRDDPDLFCGLPTALLCSVSISEMVPVVFGIYTIDSPLCDAANRFLRNFPLMAIRSSMDKLYGICAYVHLLQSSIHWFSRARPIVRVHRVYRGFVTGRNDLLQVYESIIGRVFVWPAFTSTSTDRDLVLRHFTTEDEGILFEIELHPGDIGASIRDYSQYQDEHEILIAPRSGFTVRSVEYLDLPRRTPDSVGRVRMPVVKLAYAQHWYDFDLDRLHPCEIPGWKETPFWLCLA